MYEHFPFQLQSFENLCDANCITQCFEMQLNAIIQMRLSYAMPLNSNTVRDFSNRNIERRIMCSFYSQVCSTEPWPFPATLFATSTSRRLLRTPPLSLPPAWSAPPRRARTSSSASRGKHNRTSSRSLRICLYVDITYLVLSSVNIVKQFWIL